MTTSAPDLEVEIGQRCAAGDLQGAATCALRGYGPEVFSYLMAIIRSESEASEVYAAFCEAMWRGLPDFRWQCTFRTWAYVLARHALSRRCRDPFRDAERAVPLSRASEVFEIAEHLRTTTRQYLRTEVKDRMALLREQLDPEDHALIILRINRRLSWDEIARIMCDEQPEPGEQLLRKKSAAVRKQFQRAKERLRQLAKDARILED